jgi:hypothetical protein
MMRNSIVLNNNIGKHNKLKANYYCLQCTYFVKSYDSEDWCPQNEYNINESDFSCKYFIPAGIN